MMNTLLLLWIRHLLIVTTTAEAACGGFYLWEGIGDFFLEKAP